MANLPSFALELAIRVAILLAAAALIFFGTALIPGDFVTELLGQDYTPELAAQLRHSLGLDRPLPERFVTWLFHFLQGEFGQSFTSRIPVWDVVEPRLANTLMLAGAAICWFPLALAAGVASFLAPPQIRRFLQLLMQVVLCAPEFLIAYVFIYVFAVQLQLLPAVSRLAPDQSLSEHIRVLILPSACLGVGMIAYVGRMLLSLLLMEEKKDYFEFARLRGFSRSWIALRYAVSAILPSIINLLLIYCAYLLTGVLVIEVVFGISGIGELAVSSVVWRDIPVLQFCAVFITAIYVGIYSLSDLIAGRISRRGAL
ncbi:ABC transporter permease (plasmid) [Sinorhizobium numidicum]|uniref:ABC transporter permease n=1 Tax=Sinorhizobium numidicum TaxID=680248 RepID=A0ABY8D347_9HYPH|nr:ABC transporter permease [Sinorhizobium numidicum]WEX79318.1 ABC transporter permease [Sinorhizobium numidicum]WEX85311.1 ABC transporter permease [Sinorhizobium numidicum]